MINVHKRHIFNIVGLKCFIFLSCFTTLLHSMGCSQPVASPDSGSSVEQFVEDTGSIEHKQPDASSPETKEETILESPPKENIPETHKEAIPETPAQKSVCGKQIQWKEAKPIPTGRDHHISFISEASGKPYLYVISGNTYKTVYADVRYAPIQPSDGMLGDWKQGTNLPFPMSGAGIVVLKEKVYITAGRTPQFSSSVYMGKIQPNGDITGWTKQTSIPEGRFHLSTEYAEGNIFAVGGLNSRGVAKDTIFSAKVKEDGTLGSWKLAGKMPAPRSHHSSFVKDGYLYLVGGFSGEPFVDRIQHHSELLRTKLKKDGSLDKWEKVATISTGIATHSNAVIDDCFMVLGGILQKGFGVRNMQVWRWRFGSDKTLQGQPLQNDNILEGKGHAHHAPVYKNRIYINGGSKTHRVVTNRVFVGTFQ